MNRLLTANILCLVFILSGALTGNCQESYTYQGKRYNPYLDRFSLSIGGGLSAYQGELSTFFNPKLQRYYLNPNLGANLAYRFNDYLSFMGETNIFLLSSDALSKLRYKGGALYFPSPYSSLPISYVMRDVPPQGERKLVGF